MLDCGCGTGRLSQALAESAASKVWGVDPEPEMLRVAAGSVPASVGLKEGRAEDLPFRDGWFERAVLWLVCHLVDRPVAFRELRRARSRRSARRRHVRPGALRRVLAQPVLPVDRAIDRARFPDADELSAQLTGAGFADVRILRHSQRASITREQAVERIEQRHISTFDLLEPAEVARGMHHALEELPPTVEYPIEWLVAVAIT